MMIEAHFKKDSIQNNFTDPASLQAFYAGQEAERQRIAHALHDSLGCLLSTTILLYDTIQSTNQQRYTEVRGLLTETRDELRHIIYNLMPATLEKLGLIPAVKQLCQWINCSKHVKVYCKCDNLNDGKYNNHLQVNIYRIVQELLNNALKHAQATHLYVILEENQKGMLQIILEDNGIGFSSEIVELSIAGRVKSLGGKLSMTSNEKRTRIMVNMAI